MKASDDSLLLKDFFGPEFFWRHIVIWRVGSQPLPDFPASSPDFPGSSPATSPEVLSLWNLTAIQRFPASFPQSSGSSLDRDIQWELQKHFILDSPIFEKKKKPKKWTQGIIKFSRAVFAKAFFQISLTVFNSAHFRGCQN